MLYLWLARCISLVVADLAGQSLLVDAYVLRINRFYVVV